MPGEINLTTLLKGMAPHVLPEEYVFISFSDGVYGDMSKLKPIASFQESEGLSLILTRGQAERHKIPYQGIYRCITLSVHSSLEAVGLTAAVASKLASQGISANVIAAYYHDHIFVAAADVDRAKSALLELSAN